MSKKKNTTQNKAKQAGSLNFSEKKRDSILMGEEVTTPTEKASIPEFQPQDLSSTDSSLRPNPENYPETYPETQKAQDSTSDDNFTANFELGEPLANNDPSYSQMPEIADNNNESDNIEPQVAEINHTDELEIPGESAERPNSNFSTAQLLENAIKGSQGGVKDNYNTDQLIAGVTTGSSLKPTHIRPSGRNLLFTLLTIISFFTAVTAILLAIPTSMNKTRSNRILPKNELQQAYSEINYLKGRITNLENQLNSLKTHVSQMKFKKTKKIIRRRGISSKRSHSNLSNRKKLRKKNSTKRRLPSRRRK